MRESLNQVNQGFNLACGCLLFVLFICGLLFLPPIMCAGTVVNEMVNTPSPPSPATPPPATPAIPVPAAAQPELPALYDYDDLASVQAKMGSEGSRRASGGNQEQWTFDWQGRQVVVTFRDGYYVSHR